jgi:hypothetical protein
MVALSHCDPGLSAGAPQEPTEEPTEEPTGEKGARGRESLI